MTPAGVTPRALRGGPAAETSAEQVPATLAPTTAPVVNLFAGGLNLEVEPRLVGDAWYVSGGRPVPYHLRLWPLNVVE